VTDLEALEQLQERARRFARGLHIASGFATLGAAFLFTLLLISLQWLIGAVASFKLSVFGGLGLALAVVPFSFNRLIRVLLGRRRGEWIDELVRTEGARRDVLESSFTLDSW
jgi:hypothetical protein